ncbi:uncharacterized protein ACNLHF_016619 [Anomaloglossus baeobatrachus]
MTSADLRDELVCSICLSSYTDPVMLRCGHNFCRVCIDRVLDTQDGSGVYSCPECREEFQERPALMRCITLCYCKAHSPVPNLPRLSSPFQSIVLSAMASVDFRNELECSICLSTYTDPVMLRCGHNFCRVCIDHVLDTQDGSGVYFCPQCRGHSSKRPKLKRNITLCNIIEQLFTIPKAQKDVGTFCSNCIHSLVLSVKFCLHCEVFLCENHLRVHSKSSEHVLYDPGTSLEKRKCSVHKKILEYYCTEDSACICVSCSLAGEHRGHRVEMLDEASEKKKKNLINVLQKLTTKIEETEERVQSLEKHWRKAQENAAGEAERVTALCTDIRRQVDNLEKRVLNEISKQEKEESLSLSALIHQLEIKKDELSRKVRHIEELYNMTDPLTVLQEPDTGDLCDPEEEGADEDTGGHDEQLHDGDLATINGTYHAELSNFLSYLHTNLLAQPKQINNIHNDYVMNVQNPASSTKGLPSLTPKNGDDNGKVRIVGIRGMYVAHSADILLDVNTAANNLHISDDLKTATWKQTDQGRSETAERFQDYNQVMSRWGFSSGRHYWDVKSNEVAEWMVGMCYPSIDRRGDQSQVGYNKMSWCLQKENNYSVIHDSEEIKVSDKISTMASADLRDELLCSICLSSYTDPVMLRCGHNFCRVCIDRVLDTQDESGVYSCPDCREKFQERPALMRNIALRNIMENVLFKPPTQMEMGTHCTYCVDSLCDKHLRAHSKLPEDVLSDPSTSLEKRKCSVHKKILVYYCTEDASCICVSCSLPRKHQGHRIEMLFEAYEKKEKLRNVLKKLTIKKMETEEKVKSLEERWRKAQEKAAGEAERVTALCTDIRRRVDDLEKKVLSEISRQEKEESQSLSALIHQLEIKKDELSRKMRHIEELCNMTDPLTVLQEPDTGDLCDPEEEGRDEDTGGHDKQLHDGSDLDVAVISHTLHTLCEVITDIRSGIYVEGPADILLDVNTAANNVLISDDLKTATSTRENQNRQETAERFEYNRVMSRRGFTSGRHYWDVEGSRSGEWMVGMCYATISKKCIGENSQSWGLRWQCKQYSVIHNSRNIVINCRISSNRFRICLDYGAGQLSFYELCDPIRHLHTFTAAFSEPLHAVLYISDGSIKILGRKRKLGETVQEHLCATLIWLQNQRYDNFSIVSQELLFNMTVSLYVARTSVRQNTHSFAREHRGHRLESLDGASEKKKAKLRNDLQKLTTKREESEKRVWSLEERMRKAQEKAVGEAEREADTDDLCDPEEEDDENMGRHDKQLHDGDDLDVAVISHTLHTLYEVITGIRRWIYVEDPADILLDVNTAANNIHISDDLKTATWMQENQNQPETAERFQCNQVMSRRGFTSGRHYWDVEIGRTGEWRVGMCYPSIDRRGDRSYIGNDIKSWSLRRYYDKYLVMHNRRGIRLPHNISSDSVRIHLDYEAGRLSFYELCDPIRHLHTFTATFTEPLHGVLYIWDCSIKLLEGNNSRKNPSQQEI